MQKGKTLRPSYSIASDDIHAAIVLPQFSNSGSMPQVKSWKCIDFVCQTVTCHPVAPNSSAAERGLKAGDVIVEVQQGEVTSPADVQQKVDTVRKENRKSVLMLIQRQDGLQWVPLSLSGDKDKQPG